jgi:hypothetical protein
MAGYPSVRRFGSRRGADRRLCMVLLFAGVTAMAPTHGSRAEDDAVPNLAGDWKIKIGDQERLLTLSQDGAKLEGKATRADGRTSFEVSGSVDKSRSVTLKLFWDSSEREKVHQDAWTAALKERGDDKHPGLLPIKGDLKLSDRDDAATAGEVLEGGLKIPDIIDEREQGTDKFVKLKSVEDKNLDATITRTYAERCAAEMGEIPSFDCLKGDELPITVDKGEPVKTSTDKCDKPIQLHLLEGRKDEACTPGSRLLVLQNKGHPKVVTVAICRKYDERKKEYPALADDTMFHDIAMVSHNPDTGHTCFFQNDAPSATSGKHVPSPTAANAGTVWYPKQAEKNRGGTGPDGVRCNYCHSAGPFIWSPYVKQAKSVVLDKWNPTGRWDSNFADMFGHTADLFLLDADNCTSCHRFGSEANCEKLVRYYTTVPKPNATKPNAYWMPFKPGTEEPDEAMTDQRFKEEEYEKVVKQIEDCCKKPNQAVCNTKPADGHNN